MNSSASSSRSATSDPAGTAMLIAVWCCSVGATWTLELREPGRGRPFGAIVDWISSGVPVSQPVPEGLAHELLAARGLRLFRDSPAGRPTGTRYRIGHVCPGTEPITAAADVKTSPTCGRP